MIKRLRVENFRVFESIDLELRPLNVIVGANASGKTNFVHILRFLRDLAQYGFENALSLQSGMLRVANPNIPSDIVSITVEYEFSPSEVVPYSHEDWYIRTHTRVEYSLEFGYTKRGNRPQIHREELTIEHGTAAQGNQRRFRFVRRNETVKVEEGREYLPIKYHFRGVRLSKTISVAQILFQFFLFPLFEKHIVVFDLLPRLAKQPAPITGQAELTEDGSNLALVLQRLLSDKDNRQRFLRLVQDILPFIVDMRVATSKQSLLLHARERFHEGSTLPAVLFSDGTIEVIALILILYFSPPLVDAIAIEEPDRNLHPALMSKLVEMFRDVQHHRQLIITTHNPELVSCLNPEELILIERDERGFARLKRVEDSVMVNEFVEQNLSLGTLHKAELLGI